MINFIKNRLKERTSLDGALLIGGGIAMLIAPINLVAYAMIAYGAWTLLKSEEQNHLGPLAVSADNQAQVGRPPWDQDSLPLIPKTPTQIHSTRNYTMAKTFTKTVRTVKNNKKTSQGNRNVKMASMNKSKKRSYKKYRGQG